MIFGIVFDYIIWHFVKMPFEILSGWRNIFAFTVNYFSLPLLVKTFFSPWRKIQWKGEKGFHPGAFFANLAGNLISRILGACIRFFVVCAGIIIACAVLGTGIFVFLFWIILPFVIIVALYHGFKLVF